MKQQHLLGLICLSGFVAVAIGAFGAHGITSPQAKAWVETGSSQHMAHSLALFACVWLQTQGFNKARFAVPLFGLGILLFAGSLYALALGAPRAVAMAAPLGGLCFLSGWLCLAWACFSRKDKFDAPN
ncbi:DUF423 domain-containing protein [Aquidulcibacter sp.]|jgi:uncharacterized membrane protein YgdD (TMEM256/DUF423 family)|uniref:DUF423 domain-containing protein n=1 Tax=Aquidulcibacter sp. TaxID=2052990 RepID=UPI00078EABFF|nr:hypothetical protein AEM38_08370 [Hyphomonadaceae bacterium UKL13-1]OYU50725.1 MAG: hypothetical protein CFE27_15505 [Alphaproteobacteria bacterium PA1]HCP65434.1 DUF423 domain-containing protein [Hyphomonadaceae bacterium]